MVNDKITKRKRTVEIIEYFCKCQACGKEIRGSTSSHVQFNMFIHENSKKCNPDDDSELHNLNQGGTKK